MDQECVERQQSAQNEAGRREKLTFKASRETGYWDDKDNKHWDSADSQCDMAIGKLGNGPIKQNGGVKFFEHHGSFESTSNFGTSSHISPDSSLPSKQKNLGQTRRETQLKSSL